MKKIFSFWIILLCLASPASSLADLTAIRAAFEDNDLTTAKALIQTDESPSAEALMYLARIYAREGELDEAENTIETALKKLADESNSSSEVAAEINYRAGSIYGAQAQAASVFSKLGYAKKTKKHFQKATELDSQHLGALNGLAMYHAMAPGIAGGDKEAIPPLIEKAKAIDSREGFDLEIQVLAALEKIPEAIAKLDQAIEENPADVNYHYRRGLFLVNTERYDQARSDFNIVVAGSYAAPEDQEVRLAALYQTGKLAAITAQDLTAATTNLQEYLALDDKMVGVPKAWAYYRLGQIFQHSGKAEEAAAAFAKASQSQPDNRLKKLLKKAKR